MLVNVILSGGVGSRLWPLSRKSRPKQYLPLFEGQSLFQKTLMRNRALCEGLIVVGNAGNRQLTEQIIAELQIKHYTHIVEACPRNTAAAIAFAAFAANPEDILLVSPSDHLIAEGEAYNSAILKAEKLAQEGYLVTFGIKPQHPEIGYGYIESDGSKVERFHEKPNADQALAFIKAGNYFWNSGMFCFKAETYISELKKHAIDIYQTALYAFENRSNQFQLDEDISLKIPDISVDYAVMEKSDKIKIVPANFGWSDMGSFQSIYDYLKSIGYKTDSEGNMCIGTNKEVAFLGLMNTILVYTEDALLVLQKDKAQDVKKIYEQLDEEFK